MNETLRGLLAAGTRLAYDGQWWQVAEMDGPYVLLAGQAGVWRVGAGHLLSDPSTRLPTGRRARPRGGAGPEADPRPRAAARDHQGHVRVRAVGGGRC